MRFEVQTAPGADRLKGEPKVDIEETTNLEVCCAFSASHRPAQYLEYGGRWKIRTSASPTKAHIEMGFRRVVAGEPATPDRTTTVLTGHLQS